MTKGFVFAVSSDGVCSVVSTRTGKRLTGSALKACERSVLASVKSSVRLTADVTGFDLPCTYTGHFKHGFLVSSVLKVRRSNSHSGRRLWKSESETELALNLMRIRMSKEAWHTLMYRKEFRRGFVGCGCWFSGYLCDCRKAGVGEMWRHVRVRRHGTSIRHLRAFRGDLCGSRLLLDNPVFLKAVANGACPVKLSLSTFQWPVRSAVFGSLLACLFSKRVRAVLSGVAWKKLLTRFTAAALRSLGFTGFKVERFMVNRAGLFVSHGCERLMWPELKVVKVSEGALWKAFTALSRCLDWLCSPKAGGRGCPSSLRPLVCALILSILPIIGEDVLLKKVS